MLKLAALLLVAVVIFRWAFGFWPWDLAKGPDTETRKLAAARRVLGVPADADRTEVLAAHRLAMTRAHPDRGGSAQKVHEVNAARDVLLEDLGEKPVISSPSEPTPSEPMPSEQSAAPPDDIPGETKGGDNSHKTGRDGSGAGSGNNASSGSRADNDSTPGRDD